ncbi:MAG TPA: sulfite exporter TauE/SafE family protein, partial [Dehalococcoidia bacterium]|nr:sulfite exporter TauE/SafE family protein [Dehalococcoidia bacterium]
MAQPGTLGPHTVRVSRRRHHPRPGAAVSYECPDNDDILDHVCLQSHRLRVQREECVNPALIIGGFVIGALTGLTSVGAAALTTPFLILFVGVKPVKAVSTDFVYSAATRLLGTQRHWQQHTVDKGIMLRLASASVPGLLVGTVLLHSLGNGKAA